MNDEAIHGSAIVTYWEKGTWVWYPSVDTTNRYYGPAMQIYGEYFWYIHGTRIK